MAENEVTDLLERPRHLAEPSGSFAFVLEATGSLGGCTHIGVEGVPKWKLQGSKRRKTGSSQSKASWAETSRSHLTLDRSGEAPGLGSPAALEPRCGTALAARKVCLQLQA